MPCWARTYNPAVDMVKHAELGRRDVLASYQYLFEV